MVEVLAVDQWTKQWALHALPGVGATLTLPGPVDLTLVLNRSNAFGLVPVAGDVSRWGLASVNLVVAALLAGAILWRSPGRLAMTGFALIAAGATGNALDRIRLGASSTSSTPPVWASSGSSTSPMPRSTSASGW